MRQDKVLSPKQIKALEALLTERTMIEAAKKAGVGYSTLRNWKDNDPDFKAALAEMSQKLHQQMWDEVSKHFQLSK